MVFNASECVGSHVCMITNIKGKTENGEPMY